jgi:hypothetical protein
VNVPGGSETGGLAWRRWWDRAGRTSTLNQPAVAEKFPSPKPIRAGILAAVKARHLFLILAVDEETHMLQTIRRFGVMFALMTLMLTILAACGGAAAATPVSRVESFMKDINSAFTDANLKDAAKQEEWADKLSKYFIPTEQAKQKESIKQGLVAMGSGLMSAKIENVKVEKVSETGDTAEVKLLSGKMIMTAGGETQEQDLAQAGLTGGSGENAKLQKIDGIWYLVP